MTHRFQRPDERTGRLNIGTEFRPGSSGEMAGSRERPGPMASPKCRVLILAGRLNRHDARWPLAPWLDRLERRGCRLQVLCISRGNVLADDPRCFEMSTLGNPWMREWAARTLWSHEHLERPDLVHVVHDEMSDAALIVSESSQLPYIQTLADFRTLGRGLRLSRRWCRQLVAIRPDLAAGLVEELGVPESRVAVIPPGIALPDEPARERTVGRVPVIGAGGPLDEVSGLVVFLEAARRVLDGGRDAEFLIAGQGATHVDLRRQAQALGIAERVTVAEFPSVGAEYWAVLDIYCQPSIIANAGVTLLQAMAHAVPCIATAAPGLHGLIEPWSSGVIVPPGDSSSLESAIINLLDRPNEAREMGHNARLRVQSCFDPEAEADRLVELYCEILATNASLGSSPS
jgi:glycosyltransferase involved in cell wall biosynthesis